MSYDLMVFDPKAPPPDRAGFMDWYHKQTQWKEGHSYNDPQVSIPELRNWFLEMITKYPAMNGPHRSEDVDNPKLTDYSVGKSVIYAAFAWSEAKAAFETISATDGGVYVPDSGRSFLCIHGSGADSGEHEKKWWEFWRSS